MSRIIPIILLIGSNLFMTYAWYGHLKDMKNKSLLAVILASWSVAFLEYCLQVPANRMGFQIYSLGQLKVVQEIITMVIFALFAMLYMGQRLTMNYLWAGICLVGAAFFIFREVAVPPH
ncbi:MAG: DMT family protein [Planctomycetota bacterium]